MTTCGIVLAAGRAERFGRQKLLADFHNRPLLQWTVDNACAAERLDRVIVVLGSDAHQVVSQVEFGRAEHVLCSDWDEGQAASLRCGVAAAGRVRWMAVLLGDMPFVSPATIDRVVAAACLTDPPPLAARAHRDGRPGHPVVVSARLAPRLLELTGDEGARNLLGKVSVIEVDCQALDMVDIDTPEHLTSAHSVLASSSVLDELGRGA